MADWTTFLAFLAIVFVVAFEVKTMVPRAHVSCVRGLGHLAHEEDPERIARLIGERVDALEADGRDGG